MSEKVKIQITEDEWADTTPEIRWRILELMTEHGYDISMLKALEKDVSGPTDEDIFNQFYGDEE